MSAPSVAAAEKAAEKAQQAAQAARAEHEQAIADAAERNAARRAKFWADAVEQAKTERARLAYARRAVVAAVTDCDAGSLLDAYLTYVRTHAEVSAYVDAASRATRTYEEEGRRGRAIDVIQPMHGSPDSLDKIVTAAVKDAQYDWGREHMRAVMEPLRSQLEDEGA